MALAPRDIVFATLGEKQIRNFWAGVDQAGGQDACWPWMRARLPKGYGKLGIGGRTNNRTVLAHRVAYALANGAEIPNGKLVCHRCDNPPCCNPQHLFLGTYQENADDRIGKGRPVNQPNGFKTHCKRGHPFDEANTRIVRNAHHPNGARTCKTCERARQSAAGRAA